MTVDLWRPRIPGAEDGLREAGFGSASVFIKCVALVMLQTLADLSHLIYKMDIRIVWNHVSLPEL